MSASGEEPTLFYRRAITPGTNLVDHARGLGIHLKTSRLTQYASPRKGIASPRTRASALTTRNAKSCPPSVAGVHPSQYIEDVVVPLAAKTDELNAKNAQTPRPFSAHDFTPRIKPKSEKRAKSSLPHMTQTNHNSIPNNSPRSSAKSIRTLSTFLEKYNVSSTPLDQPFLTRTSNEFSRKWNTSEQAQRYDSEKKKREKGRVLKRTSEIKPHRIDRMYYMSGSNVGLSSKYDVDDGELERLKTLSQARQESRHYGRGLSSHRGDRYHPDIGDKETSEKVPVGRPPHQPPPSSLSHHPDQIPIVPDGAIVNQERATTIDDDNQTTGRTRPSTGGVKLEDIPDNESIKDEPTKENGLDEASPATNSEASGETEQKPEKDTSDETKPEEENDPAVAGESETQVAKGANSNEEITADSVEKPEIDADKEEIPETGDMDDGVKKIPADNDQQNTSEPEQSADVAEKDAPQEESAPNGVVLDGDSALISADANEEAS